MEVFSVSFLFLLLPLLFLIIKHFKPLNPAKPPSLPPGPRPWPILGNILHMGKMPHITLTHYAQSYGPLISLRLGTQVLVVGSSPAAAEEILKTHDRIFSGRYVPSALPMRRPELNGNSLGWALDCNDKWKLLRTICRTELFSGGALQSQACMRERKVMEMVKFLEGMEGKAVGVGEVVFGTVFNMLSNVFVSRDFISVGDETENEDMHMGMKGLVSELIEAVSAPNLSDFYPVLGGLDLQRRQKKCKDVLARICAKWEWVIKERREKRGTAGVCERQDFLDVMIDSDFTDDQINQLALELLTAGTDTSSGTIEWVMAELIKNPVSMKKVQEELAKEIGKDMVKEYNLSQLSYLQACVKEALRLHPPGPFLLPHRALDSCKVMNYTIPKNAQVIVNVWAIGRDLLNWEDPLVFKPERFLNSSLDFKGSNFEYLPFGAGRRICPGLPMAAKQIPLVLASLIHLFDWSLPNGNDPSNLDMGEKFGITLQKREPLLLIPKTRK
ncbi:probable (S)-N-methylcoclaurine 3'-hydroxylase isozyme 2 [Malania oleifera]|uniref:probable (S)-N-methylcoclaurine 3'-hydroxylase isozyme 2 n=1 Tax=Malania oleifera TaxID=397392 RepID=UPI0025AE6150|nr:probable (S)-N-methylcoclaurine 3'-hydroxylase isozyme 2 [Malania oleifera]